MSDKKIIVNASDEMVGQRLDKALALLEQISTRTRASYLIDKDCIQVNQKSVKASYQVKENDKIEINFPEEVLTTETSEKLLPYDFPLDILFEDSDIIVINKPSGLVVHPAAGHANDTLVNALIAHTKDLSMKFGDERPGIVHRLDKETSGLLVVAKNDFAHESLTKQFKERSTHRIYYAVSIGTMGALSGKIQTFLARHPYERKKYSSVLDENNHPLQDPGTPPEIGKWAVTNFEVIDRKHGLSYLKLKLETGRTHQIRVHLSENRLPIVGDSLYGADKKVKNIPSKHIQQQVKNLNRFLLHAAELGFTHPRTEERMHFKVDWPKDIQDLLVSWEFNRT